MQTKFLRALGYLSLFERTTEENERIQMHADTLYHRMLRQERAIDEAREKGMPLPEVEPLIRRDGEAVSKAQGTDEERPMGWTPTRKPIKFESLPPHLQEKYTNERLKDLEGPRLELAKHELEQDLAWKSELLDRFGERYVEERRERLDRQAKGQERASDKVKRWFDMRDWSRFDEMEAQRREEQRKEETTRRPS